MNNRISIERYALKLAKVAALRSEDPFVKVGCCTIRKDKSIGSLGYNGAPSGIEINWENRKKRRKRVLHAEVNALRYIKPGECILIATTLLPCSSCVQMIAAYGIKKIVYSEIYELDKTALQLCKEWGITLAKL